ncbi:unnamed protein product, partial [Iphiclides podalirius]
MIGVWFDPRSVTYAPTRKFACAGECKDSERRGREKKKSIRSLLPGTLSAVVRNLFANQTPSSRYHDLSNSPRLRVRPASESPAGSLLTSFTVGSVSQVSTCEKGNIEYPFLWDSKPARHTTPADRPFAPRGAAHISNALTGRVMQEHVVIRTHAQASIAGLPRVQFVFDFHRLYKWNDRGPVTRGKRAQPYFPTSRFVATLGGFLSPRSGGILADAASAAAIKTALVYPRNGSLAEDIYWEGEEDSSNEFLEVREPESGLVGHLRRLKRQLFWPFSSTTEAPAEYESATDDNYDEPNGNDLDEDDANEGSGTLIKPELDTKEKTLRVTFVVMEPYLKQYSNRDSEQFQNISRGLADAVNALFNDLPGTQRANLVRIQSRLSDEFSCKVTMEIVTSGYENTKEIVRILQDHIKQRRHLGVFTVDDKEFSSADITDPGNANLDCASDEMRCDDGRCVPYSAWCNGVVECADGTDEASCSGQDENRVDQEQEPVRRGDDDEPEPPIGETPTGGEERGASADRDIEEEENGEEETCTATYPCINSNITICDKHRCNKIVDCPEGEDELGCNDIDENRDVPGGLFTVAPDSDNEVVPATTTVQSTICLVDEFRCDNTRCIPVGSRCDRRPDCDDGTDEAGCPPGFWSLTR